MTRVRAQRRARGETLREISVRTGISLGRLSMIERRMETPTALERARLAEALKLQVDELFEDGLPDAAGPEERS